ncbi:gluconate 2-dehydrogenase subunit 3 family protein [Sphingomonas faeni]|uniref:gluconate 2-dehydrogenase subunit 3 family protein n=1 Tax=Sphingomonas faeni TaxID=185950 RepID=UPI00335144EC
MTPSRRTTMQWMMTAALLPLARWSPPAMASAIEPGADVGPPFDVIVDWPVAPPLAPSTRYGRDPDLMNPKVPWSLTLTVAQRRTVDLLGDLILPEDTVSPGAGALGVGAFIDEWISAPYPVQRADRGRVVGGLIWLDAQSLALHGRAFQALVPREHDALLDALSVPLPIARMAAPVAFMDTLRKLFVLGFYSLPEGKTDMGFIGDQPVAGAYPGPSRAALAHLAQALQTMGLKDIPA